jgi:hypothetical protein
MMSGQTVRGSDDNDDMMTMMMMISVQSVGRFDDGGDGD